MNLIQLGLDAGILALCCEVVFRQKAEIKAKDFFVFPILLVLCVVPRVDFSIGANMTASFRSEGFEILPADNIVGLLFLIFAVLLLSSIFFGSKSSGTVFCGTMAAFSVFLFVKCLCVVLFAVCGATDILLLLGSRAAALCLNDLRICPRFILQEHFCNPYRAVYVFHFRKFCPGYSLPGETAAGRSF